MIAEFQKIGNDLFWSFYLPTEFINGEIQPFEKLNWTGYNDNYWWDEVSKQPNQMIRKDSKGRIYELNPHTNEITIKK